MDYKQKQQLVLTSLELLCEEHDNPRFWNNTTLKEYLKPELFLKPNKRAFNFISYFLITSLNLFDSKKNIPMAVQENDLKVEKSYYVFIREHVTKINEEYSFAEIPVIQTSFMVTGYGPKIIDFFWKFTDFALFQCLSKHGETVLLPPKTKDLARKKNISQVLTKQIEKQTEIYQTEKVGMIETIEYLNNEIKKIMSMKEKSIIELSKLKYEKKALFVDENEDGEDENDIDYLISEMENVNLKLEKVCNFTSIITETDSKDEHFDLSSCDIFQEQNDKTNLLSLTKEANKIIEHIVKIIGDPEEIQVTDLDSIYQKYMTNHEEMEKNLQDYIGNLLVLKKSLKDKIATWQTECSDEKNGNPRDVISQETPKINFNIERNVRKTSEKTQFLRTITKDRSKMSSSVFRPVKSSAIKKRLPFPDKVLLEQ